MLDRYSTKIFFYMYIIHVDHGLEINENSYIYIIHINLSLLTQASYTSLRALPNVHIP